MPYQSLLFSDRLYLVRWQLLTEDDVIAVLRDVRAAAQATGGPIFSIWIGSQQTPPPGGRVRKVLVDSLPALLRDSEVHNVLEGDNITTRLLRSLVINMFRLSRYQGRIFMYKSVQEALLALSPRLARHHIRVEDVRAAAARAGILGADRSEEREAVGA